MNKNWKNTLFLPKTDFKMKGNLREKDQAYFKQFETNKIYQKVLDKNKLNKKYFFLHDGPPYANGDLHIGHALNKILKDFVIRSKNMEGCYAPILYGWDTHGLPIENKMLQEAKMTEEDLSKVDLIKNATQYALKQVDNQNQQFKSFMLFNDFDKKYITLDKEYEANQLLVFKKMVLDKLVYKGLKPIYWSPTSKSALAEAEIEYKDVVSPQIILGLKLQEEILKYQNVEVLIMTTTPWTLLANSGVAIDPKLNYQIVNVGQKSFVLLKNDNFEMILNSILEKMEIQEYEIKEEVLGQTLINKKYQHPLNEKTYKIVEGHHIDPKEGTGLVHIAPLFGEDDFIIGKENDLEMIMHVNDDGTLNKDGLEFEKMFYLDANKEIGLKLDRENVLYSLKFNKHSYPHDWRTNKPVIYRGVPQWFINISKIKPQLLKTLDNVIEVQNPKNSEISFKRFWKMINDRNEWTISRQRSWGVPIIIFYDQDQNPILNDEKLFDHVIELIKEHGTKIWWEWETEKLLPPQYQNKNLTKEMDIMDVWFDSGTSFMLADQIIEKHQGSEESIFDLYLEGTDQFRGWFNSSLINSVTYTGKPAYKNLLVHGFVVDKNHQKMSKSKNNGIDPLKLTKQYGADVLRLWVANSEYTSDIVYSEDTLNYSIEIYRKIRNIVKFMLGNISNIEHFEQFDPEMWLDELLKSDEIEKKFHIFIHFQIKELASKIKKAYQKYEFKKVVTLVYEMANKISKTYFEAYKDVLYANPLEDINRKLIQANMISFLKVIYKYLAPIVPVTADDIYQHINDGQKVESVMLLTWDEKELSSTEVKIYQELEKLFENLFNLKNDLIQPQIEKAIKNKIVNRTNELSVEFNFEALELKDMFSKQELKEFLKTILLVGKVTNQKEFSTKEVKTSKFDSVKCERCWNHYHKELVNEDQICSRCESAVKKIRQNETRYYN